MTGDAAKLVFVTQVLDRQDAVLGFVSRWVQGLAAHVEALTVIALEVGDTSDLPGNVTAVAIGRRGRVRRFLRYRRALARAFADGHRLLLTHMVPRYSSLAAGPARRAGAVHGLWYTHKGVDRRLLKALDVVDVAFTASEESLRVDTPKKRVTGHGIDAAHFDVGPPRARGRTTRLLSVGRVTPAKDPMTVVEALHRLREAGHDVTLTWAGGALAPGDEEYGALVERAVKGRGLEDAVDFRGEVPYPDVPRAFAEADLVVNASNTGSVDKVVLEAMAARRAFVTCNESIPPLLDGVLERSEVEDEIAFTRGDAASLAERVERFIGRDDDVRAARAERLRADVMARHDVDALMGRLVAELASRRR